MTETVRLVLIGLGNLGRRFCKILEDKESVLEAEYGLRLQLVGVADSRGTAYDTHGLDLRKIAQIKAQGASVAEYPNVGQSGPAIDMLLKADADLLCEASPVNLKQQAEPGLTHVRAALDAGMHVVTPNKGPMVLAYRDLHQRAANQGVQLRFDGTVAGGLPALYIGQRDLRGSRIRRLEAVPNLVTGLILDLLGDGFSWDDALAEANRQGFLEADPSFDLDGWDAASKLVILTNAVMGLDASLNDVDRTGINHLNQRDLQAARESGQVYRLLATAEYGEDGAPQLKVAPTQLPADYFLARLGRHGMGVVYHTDIYGTQMAAIEETSPVPPAATMLRDILDIYA